jgi:hypothetical protein
MERTNLKKLNDVEVKEQHEAKVSNRFAALKNFYNDMDINWAWKITRGER